MGRADRAAAAAHRLPAPDVDGGGDDRRGAEEDLPDRGSDDLQALPEGQRAAHLRCPARLARRGRRTHPGPWDRSRRTAVQHRGRDTDLTQHLPQPRLAARRRSLRHRLPRPDPRPPPRPRVLAARRRRRPQRRDGPDGPRADPDHPEVPAHPARHRPEEPRRPHPDRGQVQSLGTF